jgi:hypothetical protein
MKWFGVGLMMVSAIIGLIAWFRFDQNFPVTVGAAVFFVIGLIVLFKG